MNSSLFSLENQNVLITGSSRGLGWSMAKAVAEAGATVLLHGRDENLLKERKQYLQELGQNKPNTIFLMSPMTRRCLLLLEKFGNSTVNWMA
jgi:NAD(P)-dependent dehydrogenase (short-subunit alcohol dehydrogenase family)